MDRAIPTFNRLVVEKTQQRNMQTHYQKLFNIHVPPSRGSTRNGHARRPAAKPPSPTPSANR